MGGQDSTRRDRVMKGGEKVSDEILFRINRETEKIWSLYQKGRENDSQKQDVFSAKRR